MMMMSIIPFGHKAMGDLFRRCETNSHQSLYVVKTTYPSVIEASVRKVAHTYIAQEVEVEAVLAVTKF
jgi:hypothetical protein